MIDAEGFRPNVGIILANEYGQVLWAKRLGHHAWQFPQGGIQYGETPEQAMFRELHEEIGLHPHHVEILAQTKGWLYYHLPHRSVHSQTYSYNSLCIGQKQKWFLLKLIAPPIHIRLDASSAPEFEAWQWVSYWYPLNQVVHFKQDVYRQALLELCSKLPIPT